VKDNVRHRAARLPRHIEVWGELADACRFWRRLAAACVALAFLGLALGTYGALVALHEPLVFAVEQTGAARALGRRADLSGPVETEVRHVAKRFLEATLAVDSDSVEKDFAEAFNFMTAELQKATRAQMDAYLAAKKQTLVEYIQTQQIRTSLEYRNIEVSEHGGTHWTVRATGQAKTWPLSRPMDEAGFSVREFEAHLTLVRVPRTEQTPNGVLVSRQTTRFFAAPDVAKRQEERIAPR
jgi:hypothetical protein